MNTKILLPAFALMVIVQLYVPASMIFQKERVISEGKAFKFRTAPIDPTDPFRGKYITLSFNENSIKVAAASDWMSGDQIFAHLAVDSAGYAIIQQVTKEEPSPQEDYLKATIDYIIADTVSTVFVRYPFDRFYMEETKAPVAEVIYNEAAIDTNQVAYALVMIKNGNAVVRDVFINEIPIRDLVEKSRTTIQ